MPSNAPSVWRHLNARSETGLSVRYPNSAGCLDAQHARARRLSSNPKANAPIRRAGPPTIKHFGTRCRALVNPAIGKGVIHARKRKRNAEKPRHLEMAAICHRVSRQADLAKATQDHLRFDSCQKRRGFDSCQKQTKIVAQPSPSV